MKMLPADEFEFCSTLGNNLPDGSGWLLVNTATAASGVTPWTVWFWARPKTKPAAAYDEDEHADELNGRR
jgi:hypothetical protein